MVCDEWSFYLLNIHFMLFSFTIGSIQFPNVLCTISMNWLNNYVNKNLLDF